MFKAIVIDDEQSAINNLKADIIDYCSDKVKIIAETTDYKEGAFLVREYNPDLVFLDIDLGEKSGFDLLDSLKQVGIKTDFHLIFTTAFNQFAIKAIKLNAFDYLLKPLDPDELINSINRLYKEFGENKRQTSSFSNFNKQDFSLEPTLKLNTQEKVYVCKINKIIRCQSERNYTKFFLSDSSPILVSKTLKEYEEKLLSYNFFKAHKAHIINISYVDSYVKQDGGYILLKDGSQVPLAKNRKDDFLQLF